MIRIIKFIYFNLSWVLLFREMSRYNYRNIFDNFNIQLMTLSPRSLFTFSNNLLNNRFSDISVLNTISTTFNEDWKILYDSITKKFTILGFVFTLLVYRWLVLFKRVILWPFKLGIFSFLYSIIGIDMSWFLSLFNLFSVNIPNWVYIQYLTLYNNWLSWWYNTVNVKSINSLTFGDNKSAKDLTNSDSSNSHLSRNWRKYISGLIVLSFFALLYFLFYDDYFPSTGGSGGTSSVSSTSVTNIPNPVTNTPELASTSTSATASSNQVQTTNTQPAPVNDAVAEMNRRMNTTFLGRPLNPPNYGANTRVTSWPITGLTRFNVLDQLDPRNRSGSPTGSTDSSETITPSRLSRVLDSVSDRAGENDPQDL